MRGGEISKLIWKEKKPVENGKLVACNKMVEDALNAVKNGNLYPPWHGAA